MPSWSHDMGSVTQELDWSMATVAAIGRGELPLGHGDTIASQISLYAQLAGGLGIGHAHFSGAQGEENTHDYFGPAVSTGAGVHLESSSGHMGASLGYQLDYAPVIDDRIGHTHAAGGSRLAISLTYGY